MREIDNVYCCASSRVDFIIRKLQIEGSSCKSAVASSDKFCAEGAMRKLESFVESAASPGGQFCKLAKLFSRSKLTLSAFSVTIRAQFHSVSFFPSSFFPPGPSIDTGAGHRLYIAHSRDPSLRFKLPRRIEIASCTEPSHCTRKVKAWLRTCISAAQGRGRIDQPPAETARACIFAQRGDA